MKMLKKGDYMCVVSFFLFIESIGGFEVNFVVKEKLEDLGFKFFFLEYYFENDIFDFVLIVSCVVDLEVVFVDELVDVILMIIGGFNCNEFLFYLDFDLIVCYLKIFCGYLDMIVLFNVIYVKMGMLIYMGLVYLSFKMDLG